MEEEILEMIERNLKMDFKSDGENTSKEIAGTFERFLSWINEFCLGYGNGWLLKPHTKDEQLFETHSELFTYWNTNIKDK